MITILFAALALIPPHEPSNLLSIFGIWVSVTGVLLAFAIYRRQTADSNASEERLTSRMSEQSELIAHALESANRSDADPAAVVEVSQDLFAEATEIASNVGVLTGAEQDFYLLKRDDIPLSVLSDLVIGWQSANLQGKWTVGNAEYALRRIGKGNHPWFVIFRDSSEQRRLWRISRGGQGRAEPTVRELALDN